MLFLKNFFTSIYKSGTDIRWLRDMRDKPNSAWTYFFSFMLFIVLIQMLALMVTVPRGAKRIWYGSQGHIPEFTAIVEDGRLRVEDLEQPFVVESEKDGEQFRLVIDTQSDVALSEDEVFDDTLDAGIFITADQISFYDAESGQTRSEAFPRNATWRFNRSDTIMFGNRFVGTILPFLIPLAILFVFLFWSAGKLAYLVFLSFLIWIAGMFAGREWRYSEVYTVGLYAITLPTVIAVIFAWMSITLPFVYTIILLVMMFVAIFGTQSKKIKSKRKKKKITKK